MFDVVTRVYGLYVITRGYGLYICDHTGKGVMCGHTGYIDHLWGTQGFRVPIGAHPLNFAFVQFPFRNLFGQSKQALDKN